MTLKTRVIPILQWDGKQAVKAKKFSHPPRPVGSMMQHIKVMQERDVDELIILDIMAKREGRSPLFEEIKEYTSQLYCPVTVGGGISTLEDIELLLKAGADKVCINSNLYKFSFIKEAASKFGRQCIVASIDASMDPFMVYRSTSYLTTMQTMYPVEFLSEILQEHGVGELLLTDMTKEGTLEGYGIDLLETIKKAAISIPVIINGGCGKPEHMVDALEAGAHAVAASSMFLFTDVTPKDCSVYLKENGYEARI